MFVELVHTVTSDQMRLDGVLIPHGENGPREEWPDASEDDSLDAMLILHGVGGNFYGSTLLQSMTEQFLADDLAVLRVNTRGHDGLHTTRSAKGVGYQGAAFETVSECTWDVRAWVDWLVKQGYQRVGICGHSLGAIKAVYSQAYDPHPAVRAVLAVSPPRLSAFAFRNGPESSKYLSTLEEARQWVDEGEPQRLIRARFPFPLYITAAGYLDKYGAERYNLQEFARNVGCSTLFVYGRKELESGSIAFAGLDDAVREWSADSSARMEVHVIDEADHFYTGVFEALRADLAHWLGHQGLLPPQD